MLNSSGSLLGVHDFVMSTRKAYFLLNYAPDFSKEIGVGVRLYRPTHCVSSTVPKPAPNSPFTKALAEKSGINPHAHSFHSFAHSTAMPSRGLPRPSVSDQSRKRSEWWSIRVLQSLKLYLSFLPNLSTFYILWYGFVLISISLIKHLVLLPTRSISRIFDFIIN